MKWLPKQELSNSNKCLQNLAITRHLSKTKFKAAILAVCLTGVSAFLASYISRVNDGTLASVSPHTLSAEVSQVANEITIKILGKNFLGSGFILQREGKKYTVITNQHVLRAGDAPYTIQTPDGKIYPATVLINLNSTAYDLAILEFEVEDDTYTYKTATIGNSLSLQVGEPIFAAGFAAEAVKTSLLTSDRRSLKLLTGFSFKKGRITVILDKALEEGYQIGYTNDVQKGMSGGPLLNSQGKVVGVNGKHAYPLWEAPDFYQDGSQPCAPLQELITRSSLAIPIEKGIGLTPNLKSLQPITDLETTFDPTSSSVILDSDTSKDTSGLIKRMQQEAKNTKNCQSSPQKAVINL